jgi:large subunit ribosomal protein L10
MKKLGNLFKDSSEKIIKSNLNDSGAVFIIKYSGLSSPDLSSLRQNLKKSEARLFVVKNSVARRAIKDTGLDTLIGKIDGPCGFIFVKNEPVGASKVICDFSKDHEHLKLEGGFLDNEVLEKKDIELMAKLPSKEVLRALVVGALNSPISGLVYVLNGTLRKFVYCLDQIKNKKGN